MTFMGFLHDNFVPHTPPAPTSRTTTTSQSASHPQEQPELFGSEKKKTSAPGASGLLQLEIDEDDDDVSIITKTTVYSNSNNVLHRSLRGRHVQLLGIGATIGSALFVAIGRALANGGPLNLLLAFVIWSFPILFITISTAEYVTYLPITSPFVRMAGRCCDEALEIMTAWNFWFLCGAQIPFEITTVNTILHFWRDDYSPAIPLAVQTVLYFMINVLGVGIYGETEFWLSIGKVILATGLLFFTFITMVGGNPQHYAFGFTYWQNPGPMAEYYSTGDLGRFQGFLACLIQACFTFAGPEYVSSVASETVNPRKTLPLAFKQVFVRLTIFFVGGALSVGVLVAYNDPILLETLGNLAPGAGASPYVIAMTNLHIKVLPHILNAMLVVAAFSAGNSYTYCSSRTLYGFALDGFTPRFLTATTKTGIPIYCVLISLCWGLLSFLQLGKDSGIVLTWIINIITLCQLINFTILCVVYVFFHRALKAQNISRDTLPFKGWFQPYLAYIGGASAFVMVFVSSYPVFLPGRWSIQSFLFLYIFIFIDIVIFVCYKLIKRTKWRKAAEVDLVSGLKEVELHEMKFYEEMQRKNRLDDEGNVKYNFQQKFFSYIFGSEL